MPHTTRPIPGAAVQRLREARIRNLRFFATGTPLVLLEDRSYRKRFSAGSTRYVGVELHLRYAAPGQEMELPVACIDHPWSRTAWPRRSISL